MKTVSNTQNAERYSAPAVEVLETAMQNIFCQSGQTSKYNPDGDTEGWF